MNPCTTATRDVAFTHPAFGGRFPGRSVPNRFDFHGFGWEGST